VLQELFVTLSGKIPNPVDHETVTGIIRDLLNWRLVVNDGFTILEAINIQRRYLLSFWDSLIIGAVVGSEARMLVSEDLSHHQMIENIKIINPFITPVSF
jgi:predicted nucleic acid-binding protein